MSAEPQWDLSKPVITWLVRVGRPMPLIRFTTSHDQQILDAEIICQPPAFYECMNDNSPGPRLC